MITRPRSGLVGVAALAATLAGALLWLLLLGGPWRLASGMLDARTHITKAQKALTRGSLKQARYHTLAGKAAAQRAEAGLATGGPLFEVARLVPEISGLLDQTPHLVDAALHSARAAQGTLNVAQNALRGPHKIVVKDPQDPQGGSRIRLERVRALRDVVAGVLGHIRGVKNALGAVDVSVLPRRLRPDVRQGIAEADQAISLLTRAEQGLSILPSFLGADGPRTYLIGMQNSAEQRGTGGAILQFALLSIAEGNPDLVRNKGGSVYNVDIDREQISIPLPEDAWYVRGIPDAQRFGNANWSPDWPLSARLTIDYATASDPSFPDVDGFIAVDPPTMQRLMPGVGPFRVKAGHRFTSRSVVHFVLYKAYASYPIPGIRRAVLRQVVNEFYEGMLKPLHPTELVKGMGDALAHKHMQVWLQDEEEQAFVEKMDWDGAIEPADDSDYLFVVEQNVGGNKLDYFDENHTTMTVRPRGRSARVSTSAKVHNGVFLPQPRWSMGDSGPLHRPMINVYVPRRARLLDARVKGTRIDSPPAAPLAVWSGNRPAEHFERGKKVWSATLLIPPDEDAAVRYRYVVPGAVTTEGGRDVYRLLVQKQPKVRPEMLTVRVRLPRGATAIKAPGFEERNGMLVWEKALVKDKELTVSWRD